MPKDDRLYAKFTLDFVDHPKVAILSDGAFRTLVEMIIYSRKHLLDGLLPLRLVLLEWTRENIDELCANDPQNPSLKLNGEHCILHDINEHQTTRDEVSALREARIAAGRKGGLASAQAKSKQVLKQTSSKRSSKQASKIKPETETYKYITPTGLCTTKEHAGRSNGAPAHTNGRPPPPRTETFEEALARAEREAEEIF